MTGVSHEARTQITGVGTERGAAHDMRAGAKIGHSAHTRNQSYKSSSKESGVSLPGGVTSQPAMLTDGDQFVMMPYCLIFA
jgi:hypothetical protein